MYECMYVQIYIITIEYNDNMKHIRYTCMYVCMYVCTYIYNTIEYNYNIKHTRYTCMYVHVYRYT